MNEEKIALLMGEIINYISTSDNDFVITISIEDSEGLTYAEIRTAN